MDAETHNGTQVNGNQPGPAAPEMPPGVLLFAKQGEQGLVIGFEMVGGLHILAAPAVLELGTKAAREHLGLSP